ncbi:MAG: lipid-A-disaccharide synthase [Bacteroidales bacterium]|nr:lipid-A-disaccharide synthase [Bacteroidales bacterium]
MKYYIIAGEASGDLHASNLIRELKRLDPDSIFRAWGGNRMQEQGAELVMHYRHMAFMGFVEVIKNLRTILRFLKQCKSDIIRFKPDVVILVDYPGFNFRIAEFAHGLGIKVFYYISPQVWAWKRSRVLQVKKWVDRMFVILPFEKEFYKRSNVEVDFVGHPLLDAIENYNTTKVPSSLKSEDKRPVVALLAGSRKQEVNKMLPAMLAVVPNFPGYRFIIAGTSSVPASLYKNIIGSHNAEIITDQTYQLLSTANAAIVTSGTATLETALFHVPQVVCYKGNWISVQIARQLVKIEYISLVNLVMNQAVVSELIQNEMNPENLSRELGLLLNNSEAREKMISNYKLMEIKLGGAGASARTAKLMWNILNHIE